MMPKSAAEESIRMMDQDSPRNRFRIVVFLSGRGSNFRAIAEALDASAPAAIVRVISDRKSAAGLEYAASRGIPCTVIPRSAGTQTPDEFHCRLEEAAAAENPDLIVLAGFMRILSPGFVMRFAGKVVNIHPSLLPSFRGLDAQGQALAAGVTIAGCTVHYVTQDLDGGPIIAQAAVAVLPGDTGETLSERILREEHVLYPAVVLAIARGEVALGKDGRVERTGPAPDANSAFRIFPSTRFSAAPK